jgi:hypothetical protein
MSRLNTIDIYKFIKHDTSIYAVWSLWHHVLDNGNHSKMYISHPRIFLKPFLDKDVSLLFGADDKGNMGLPLDSASIHTTKHTNHLNSRKINLIEQDAALRDCVLYGIWNLIVGRISLSNFYLQNISRSNVLKWSHSVIVHNYINHVCNEIIYHRSG